MNLKKYFFSSVVYFILLIEICFIVFTSWNFDKTKATECIVSSCFAFIAIFLIYEPLKVLVIASYKTFYNKQAYDISSDSDLAFPESSNETKLKDRCNQLYYMLRKSLYEPISFQDQEILRKKLSKEFEKEKLLSELLLVAFFLFTLSILVLSIYHPLSFFSSENIKNRLVEDKFSVMSMSGVISDVDLKLYLENTFLETIHNGKDEQGKRIKDGNGWVSEGFVRMLGVPRLRQLRVEMTSCGYEDCIKNCVGDFSESSQESRHFSVGWKMKRPEKYQEMYNRVQDPWKFSSSSQLKTLRYSGFNSYPGCGYVSKLGRTANNSYKVLEFLLENQWVDRQTKAIFIETSFYSVDSGIFNVVTLALERSPFGNWIASSQIQTSNLLINLSDVNVFLPLIMFLILLTILIKKTVFRIKTFDFFKHVWNIVDLIIIVFSIAFVVSMFMRNVHVGNLIDALKNTRNNEFTSFSYVAFHDSVTTAIAGFLIAISTIRLWKVLNFSRRFRSLNLTLYLASQSLMSIASLLMILLLGFSSTVYVINGMQSELFSTYLKTMTALMAHSLGFSRVIHYEDLMHGGKILGVTFSAFFMGLFNFFLLNIFTSIILVYITKVREEMKKDPPSNVKLTQVIMKKLRKIFGWAPKNELEFFHREYTTERAQHVINTLDSHIEYLENYLKNESAQ